MKVLLQQVGSKCRSREEVTDALAGLSSVQGCVFAYADFQQMRPVGFFELGPMDSIPDEATVLRADTVVIPRKGQRWVIGGKPDA